MPKYKKAGADAAGAYDAEFDRIIANDPDIQRVIQGVWGTGPRPSDTPKHLEKANDAASKQITQILKAKGITLPDRTFINPRSGNLEGHRGWSGLNGIQKAAIIAAAAGTGVAGAAALGAFGGAAGAGTAATGSGIGVSSGLPAGMAGVGATGVVPGATGGLMNSMLVNAGINAAKSKITGGSWKDALFSGATGALTGGGGNMGWGDILKNVGTGAAKDVATSTGQGIINNLLSGRGLNAMGQGLSAVGQTQAHNRGVALDAMMQGDQVRLAAEQDRRAAESDIIKKMQIANYIKSGGANFAPAVSSNGKAFPTVDFGVRPTSDSEREMATTLEGQLKHRLENPFKTSDYESKMEPGGWEKFNNIAGPVLAGFGASQMPSNTGILEKLLNLNGGRSAAQPTPTPQAPPVPGIGLPGATGVTPSAVRPNYSPFEQNQVERFTLG